MDEWLKRPHGFGDVRERTVGRLTPKMSQDMLPAVEYLEQRGLVTCVRALVKGNALKADVVLYSARAGDLSTTWLAGLKSAAVVQAQRVELGSGTQASNVAADALPPTAPVVLPPANWYPDPHGVKRLRYWDGGAWTEYLAD